MSSEVADRWSLEFVHNPRVPKSPLDETFAALRALVAAQSKGLLVIADKPGDYQVGSPTMKDRIGRPLYIAASRPGRTTSAAT